MLDRVLQILRDDTRLSAMITGIEPHSTGDITGNSIVYTLTPLTDNRIVRTDRFEIHIIAKSIAEREKIDREVRRILLTFGDIPLDFGILQVWINGGGTMEDYGTNTYHQIIYYIITSRSEC